MALAINWQVTAVDNVYDIVTFSFSCTSGGKTFTTTGGGTLGAHTVAELAALVCPTAQIEAAVAAGTNLTPLVGQTGTINV